MVERDPEPGLVRRLIDLVHDMSRDLGERGRVLVRDPQRIPAAASTMAAPCAHRPAASSSALRTGASCPARIRLPKLDVRLQDTVRADAGGRGRALGLTPRPAIAHDIEPVDPREEGGIHRPITSARTGWTR
jgi:hypothetical protein